MKYQRGIRMKGVKFLRMEDNAAVYEVGSGCYQFCSEMTSERKNK